MLRCWIEISRLRRVLILITGDSVSWFMDGNLLILITMVKLFSIVSNSRTEDNSELKELLSTSSTPPSQTRALLSKTVSSSSATITAYMSKIPNSSLSTTTYLLKVENTLSMPREHLPTPSKTTSSSEPETHPKLTLSLPKSLVTTTTSTLVQPTALLKTTSAKDLKVLDSSSHSKTVDNLIRHQDIFKTQLDLLRLDIF